MIDIHTNIPLKNYTTMKLGGNARFMTDVHSVEEIQEIFTRASQNNLPIYVLGGGSNTIVRDEGYAGIVIRNRIMGTAITEDTPGYTCYRVGAGENWDEFVAQTVTKNLHGIEALSHVPGTVGASPVQNIGAYGQDVAAVITAVETYDSQTQQAVTLTTEQCDFSYRHSIFRGSEQGRYVITHVHFKLSKDPPKPPFYKAIEEYFAEHSITIFTPQVIRDAVIAIRTNKLPDPKLQPNAGSFFKNAVIEDWLYQDIIKNHPDMPSYDMPNKSHKIPTGWLIEQTGLKGRVLHGMRIHDKNALVLINESATNYADLAAARTEIQNAVRDMFRIDIQQEPLEI